ncbi:MAG: PLP-dependent aminotransferase family protein [Nevskiaceae bacterium]|nr:MAG: PLP-dependent aminotransferase family protein [Nevskiaceae bacterium]
MKILLNSSSPQPIYLQIYLRYREAISEGILKPGDRVPSIRNLADDLNLARRTIETAYEMLIGEGYFLSRGQGGTVVAPFLGEHISTIRLQDSLTPSTFHRSRYPSATPLPLSLGLPALDAFPRKLWAKLGSQVLRSATEADMGYPSQLGLMSLRTAIAAYLNVSRGISCKPEQVIITDGYRGSLDLICRAFLTSEEKVWMEDPGYPAALKLIQAVGSNVVYVPVDEEGIVVSQGISKAPDARMAVVTPSHQSPLGMTLSLERRLELLEWAANNESWIVEDDYDGEYRYTSRTIPALKSLDSKDRVIFCGTISKVISPSLRLAYLVIPESQVTHLANICQIYQNGCPWLTQAIVAEFISQGYFSRHLKKMRVLYKRRREHLVQALYESFGKEISIELQAGGMHLVVRFNKTYEDRYLVRHLNEAGFGVRALSAWSAEYSNNQGLIMSFTNIHSLEYARQTVSRMKQSSEQLS